jgi:ADP-heptose:LPS heptosyltransferase
MTTPGLHGLREKFPGARISLSVRKVARPIYVNNPNINAFVGRYRRGKALESFAARYDLFFNLKNSIAGNPIAEVENAYDLICNRLQVKPSNMLPELFLTAGEYRCGKNVLQSAGLLPAGRGLILIHGEASNIYRCLSQTTLWRVARYFVRKGYKIGILGINNQRSVQFIEPNVIPIHEYASKYGIRIMFALLKFAYLFIGIDSGFSHAAAALRIPSVLLYGPIDSYLRAKYFASAVCIQAKVKCGPCQSHFFGKGYCPMYPNEIPECMASITSDDIIRSAEQILSTGVPDSYGRYFQKALNYNSPRNCPFCGNKNSRLYKRISRTLYFECRTCFSIFDYRDKSNNEIEVKNINNLVKSNTENQRDLNTNIRDWLRKIVCICLNSDKTVLNSLPRMDYVGLDVCIAVVSVEKTNSISGDNINRYESSYCTNCSNKQNAETSIANMNTHNRSNVLVIKNLNQFGSPRRIFAGCLKDTPSLRAVIILINLRNRRLSRDTALLFPQANFFATLPSKQGLEYLLEAEGWYIERYIRINSWPNNMAVVLRTKQCNNLSQEKKNE